MEDTPAIPHVPLYQMRQFIPADYATFEAWRRTRGAFVPPLAILPPTSYVLDQDGEPCAMLCAYCTVGVGVAILEWVTGPPGRSPLEARHAFSTLYQGVKQTLAALDYGVAFAHTSKQIARECERVGMVECSTGNIFLMGNLREIAEVISTQPE